jgi:hypothetical protein
MKLAFQLSQELDAAQAAMAGAGMHFPHLFGRRLQLGPTL